MRENKPAQTLPIYSSQMNRQESWNLMNRICSSNNKKLQWNKPHSCKTFLHLSRWYVAFPKSKERTFWSSVFSFIILFEDKEQMSLKKLQGGLNRGLTLYQHTIPIRNSIPYLQSFNIIPV